MLRKVFICVFTAILAAMAGTVARAQTYSNAVMSLNPVAYWPLSETTTPPNGYYVATNLGTAGAAANGYYQTWYQASGTGFYPTNNIQHTSGATGDGDQAMSGTGGMGQYVIFPRSTNGVANPAVAIQGPFSIELWVKSGNTNLGVEPLVTEGRNPVALDPAVGSTNTYVGFSLGQYKNFFYFQVYNARANGNGSVPEVDTAPIVPNTWYHVVATFDGTGVTIYANAAASATKAVSPNYAGQRYVVDPVSPLLIGTGTEISAANGGITYNGAIDEVAIYPTALDASQISAHYAAGSGTSYSSTVLADNPIIYLRLNEPAMNTYPSAASYPVAVNYGSLGSAANGVYQPGTAPGAAGPAYAGFGASSHAVAINGFYGAVDIGDGALPAQLNPTGTTPFTVVTWFQGNPADAPGRFQELLGHSDRSWRFAMDGQSASVQVAGNRFNPGNGPELSFASTADVVTNGFRLNDGNWHFVAGVSDGASAYMYLDGVLARSNSPVGSIVGTNLDVILGGDPQYMNPSANSPTLRYFDGQLAHVAFFTNALSAAQIQQIYSAAGVPASLFKQPQSATVNAGTSLTLSSSARGSAPLSYQWYQNGVSIPTQTGANITFNPVATNNAGSYFVVVTNPYGSVTSSVVQLTVFGAPIIQQQPPTDMQVFAGTSPTLSVTAAGAQPLSYQWTLNGSPIPGANSSTYTASNVQTSGSYSCVISNFVGTTPISPIALTVIPAPTAPYPMKVLSDGPVAYFRLDESSGTTAYDYAGGNNATYTNATLSQPGYNSSAAVPTDPTQTSVLFGQNGDNSYAGNVPATLNFGVTNGGNAQFTIEAWITQYLYLNGGSGIIAVGTGNGGEQFVLDTGASASGALRFFVRNAAGTVSAANSSFSPKNDVLWHHVVGVCDEAAGHIYLYLDGVLLATGNITPNSGLLAATAPLSIGARQSGNTSPANYDFQFIGLIDDVAIYNKALTAAQVQSHFYAAGVPPIITQFLPADQITTNQGANVKFTVTASGTAPLSYQWSDNNGSPIASGTTSALTLNNVQQSQQGNYTVVVSNPYGSTTTNVNLTVVLGPPQITVDLQPTSVVAYAGTSNTFSVTVSGSAPFYYQWYKNGTAITGANASSYTFAVLAGTNTYYCAVTNAYSYSQAGGPTYSSTATVAGIPAPTLDPNNYTYHAKITFSGYNRNETLSDFPVLVRLGTNLAGFAYSQLASPTGGDLRFTDASGTRVIPHEIDEWNPDGTSTVWVQVPRLSGTNDYIWAYWGNPADTTLPATATNGAVWIPAAFESLPQYDVVYHLKEGSFPYLDSTLQHTATNGIAPVASGGIVGTAEGFDGLSQYLDAGAADLGDDFTLSAWVKLAANARDIQTVWANQKGGYGSAGFVLYVNSYQTSDGQLRLETGNGANGQAAFTAGGVVSVGQWHLLCATLSRTAGSARLYVDGADVTQSGGLQLDFPSSVGVNLGRLTNGALYLNGSIDEARIRSGTNSANWIWASYMTVASNSVFSTYSTVVSSAVTISYQVSGGNLVLTWPQGTLQSADQVSGPYTDISSAASPYTVPRSGAQKYYRVRVR
jgi:Concanavalin A-like lectin/glucanases superfamily/Immunoglobulin I-set domain/Immunoglobulin domain/Domain of unknown function (DUF2341)